MHLYIYPRVNVDDSACTITYARVNVKGLEPKVLIRRNRTKIAARDTSRRPRLSSGTASTLSETKLRGRKGSEPRLRKAGIKAMLTLLIRATPLSEKCKRSCTLENGVQAKLSPIRLHLVSDIAAAPSPVEVIAPPPILKMACAVSMTSVPASIVNTDRHFITLYDRARAATVCGGDCRTVTTPAAICNLEGTTAPRCPSSSATTPTILLGPMSGSESPPQAYGDPGPDPADTLRWCEARRTGSEPAGLQSWLSTGSLESEREDDDVFTVTDSEVWYVCEDAEESFSGEL